MKKENDYFQKPGKKTALHRGGLDVLFHKTGRGVETGKRGKIGERGKPGRRLTPETPAPRKRQKCQLDFVTWELLGFSRGRELSVSRMQAALLAARPIRTRQPEREVVSVEGEKDTPARRKPAARRRTGKGFAWREYTDSLKAKEAMDAYFDACDENGTLYGEAGVALALGISLKTLRSWKHGEVPGFLDVAEYAYMRIAAEPDHNPVYRDKAMITRSIYLSKQQDFLGYKEKSEENRSVEVNVNFGANMDRSDFD